MTVRTWDVTIYPRLTRGVPTWGGAVSAKHFRKDGVILSDRFDENEWKYNPSYSGLSKMKFGNPDGQLNGASDPRSIFPEGRFQSVVYVEDFYTGLLVEQGTKEMYADAAVVLSVKGISEALRMTRVPDSALAPSLPANEFLRRCLAAARRSVPLPPELSPFHDIRDEVRGNGIYESLLIDDPRPFSGKTCFEAIGAVCGATNTVAIVGRRHCGIYNRRAHSEFGSITVADGITDRSLTTSDGFERVYTSAEVKHGGSGDAFIIEPIGGAARRERGERRLSLELGFITRRARAAEVAERIMERLCYPSRQVTFEIEDAGRTDIQLLSEVEMAVDYYQRQQPATSIYGTEYGAATYADSPRQRVHGMYFILQIERDLGRNRSIIRAQRTR